MSTARGKHVLIVGGGSAGITVAASLLRRAGGDRPDVTIIEPAETHYYQPALTLVGAGAFRLESTRRDEATLIPAGVEWVRDAVSSFEPERNHVRLRSGAEMGYDFLVVCPGVELNWDKIAGAAGALGRNGVCSNYSPDFAEYTWDTLQNVQAGATLLFTQPPLPFKCPGAPQKIAYLAADHLRRRGILQDCKLHFLPHAPVMFGVPFFARELAQVAARWGIQVHFQHNLVAVDGARRMAIFEVVGGERQGQRVEMQFDMLHLAPPQSPPAAVRSSPLANQAGYVEVDQNTLQHVRFANVFGLGDAGSTPNTKTAAAVRKQAPVVVRNLLRLLRGGTIEKGYDGYGSCPLTTAYGKVIMAEFIYGGKVTPTFPLDPRRERWVNWWMKATALPLFYWHYMLQGREAFFQHRTDYIEPS